MFPGQGSQDLLLDGQGDLGACGQGEDAAGEVLEDVAVGGRVEEEGVDLGGGQG